MNFIFIVLVLVGLGIGMSLAEEADDCYDYSDEEEVDLF